MLQMTANIVAPGASPKLSWKTVGSQPETTPSIFSRMEHLYQPMDGEEAPWPCAKGLGRE